MRMPSKFSLKDSIESLALCYIILLKQLCCDFYLSFLFI
ncbi:hypothetical protein HMPREF7215_1303 [Pyramidobacter piscolens W5455]|uniref:Uncharacterized protein n=1 Tax=Pyramidobacter piscolens W5455 TaxID=352165 RepID=A0ABP2HR58_9BACT|nr:hypothetical protein HMPREF7215_1303 [Pyramidobacter piscolens W5455]